jgi:hypothetical protein
MWTAQPQSRRLSGEILHYITLTYCCIGAQQLDSMFHDFAASCKEEEKVWHRRAPDDDSGIHALQ